MIKVLIASFSQSGSTKKIADLIAAGLNSSKCEITHFAISGNELGMKYLI
jgi:flavodoxin